jgi:hypothetical protein
VLRNAHDAAIIFGHVLHSNKWRVLAAFSSAGGGLTYCRGGYFPPPSFTEAHGRGIPAPTLLAQLILKDHHLSERRR